MNSSGQAVWKTLPLIQVATLQRGFDLPVQDRIAGEVPVFAANGTVGTHNVVKVQGPGVITGRSGTIGKVHYVSTGYWPLNTSLFVSDFHGNHPKFIYYLLSTMRLERYHEGTGVPTLNRNNVHSVEVSVPQLPEQKRIADILDKADAIRLKHAAMPELTRAMILSRFGQMFGERSSLRNRWEVTELDKWVDPNRPITYGILKPGPDFDSGIPYVRVVDIQGDRILANQVRRTSPEIAHEYRRSTIREGDILLSIRGHVGRLGTVPASLTGANITQDTARIAVADPRYQSFLFWFLDSPEAQRWMERHVRGVAVTGINLGDVRRIPVPKPSVDLVREFDKFQAKAWSYRLKNETAAEASTDLFNSLVQRAFRGEL